MLAVRNFARLAAARPAPDCLSAFIDGFRDYVDDGNRPCLIAVLAESSGGKLHGSTISAQFDSWSGRLAGTFEAAGLKPRAAERAAADLLAGLYGHLRLAQLRGTPSAFKKQAKRLKKALPR